MRDTKLSHAPLAIPATETPGRTPALDTLEPKLPRTHYVAWAGLELTSTFPASVSGVLRW